MPFDADDLVVINALFLKFRRTHQAEADDLALKVAVDERLMRYKADWDGLRAAFAMYGLTGFTVEEWEKFREKMGLAAFNAMLDYTIAALDTRSSGAAAIEEKAQAPAIALSGTVREIVLSHLQNIAPSGTKAAHLRQIIENARGELLHEKTVGMTLYRLLKDGLVRHEGRTWFFVPETKNPGAVTPGLFNAVTEKE